MNKKSNNCIALIPARAGSKRIPKKNISILNGHPLIAYSICAALQSKIFDRVIVSTDSEEIAKTALSYGAEVPFLRPERFSGDLSPDIEWVKDLLLSLKKSGDNSEFFSILRPTSPFRLSSTIRRAWNQFVSVENADSLRAVEKCTQHPAKMWVLEDKLMKPLMNYFNKDNTPGHSLPYQVLPLVYVQNASLEIARCKVVYEKNSISGNIIVPFISEGYEGFDINYPFDLKYAEELIKTGEAILPEIIK